MKKVLFIFLSVCLFNASYAQISDEEAKQLYQEAEDQFDVGNFNESYHICNELIKKMGQQTPKTLYLELKAIYNNLESPKDKSKRHLDKSYANYLVFVGYCKNFFTLVNRDTYPSEKYNEIVQIHQNFQQGLKDHEHEKNRTTESAFEFLSECVSKFQRSTYSYRDDFRNNNYVKLSLDSIYLKVETESRHGSIKTKHETRKKTIRYIDLSQITGIEKLRSPSGAIWYCLIGVESYENNKNILNGLVEKYVGSIEWSRNRNALDGFSNNKIQSNPTDALKNWTHISSDDKNELDIINILGISRESDEYKNEKYEQRITDAFQFIIDSFPKKEVEDKNNKINKSKTGF